MGSFGNLLNFSKFNVALSRHLPVIVAWFIVGLGLGTKNNSPSCQRGFSNKPGHVPFRLTPEVID
jgi:hypothetical protein